MAREFLKLTDSAEGLAFTATVHAGAVVGAAAVATALPTTTKGRSLGGEYIFIQTRDLFFRLEVRMRRVKGPRVDAV